MCKSVWNIEENFGLVPFPLFFGSSPDLLPKNKRTLFIPDDDVRKTMPAHIACSKLGSHAGIGIDEMRYKFRPTVGPSDEFEPIDHGLSARLLVFIAAMRPEAPASHDVLEPVAGYLHKLA